jgi:uncharacterized protein YjbI with pentapeptide repeats
VTASPEEHVEEDFGGVDWYARDLVGERFVRCRFVEADLTEITTTDCVFEECDFGGAKLNASVHRRTAFDRSRLRRTNLFDSVFEVCRLAGTVVAEGCTLRPLKVVGGDWSYVTLRGVDLSGTVWESVRLTESDLSMADLTDASLRGCELTGVTLRHAVLRGTDLRETSVAGVDLVGLDLTGAVVDPAFAVALAQAYGADLR